MNLHVGTRVKLGHKIGKVAHITERRSARPILVTFNDGSEGCYAESELTIFPSNIPCDRCGDPRPLSIDGWAFCPKCQHRIAHQEHHHA